MVYFKTLVLKKKRGIIGACFADCRRLFYLRVTPSPAISTPKCTVDLVTDALHMHMHIQYVYAVVACIPLPFHWFCGSTTA